MLCVGLVSTRERPNSSQWFQFPLSNLTNNINTLLSALAALSTDGHSMQVPEDH
jgi:hypothetical protein